MPLFPCLSTVFFGFSQNHFFALSEDLEHEMGDRNIDFIMISIMYFTLKIYSLY